MVERQPVEATEPAPLDLDGVTAVLVGTIAWAVATVVLLLLREQLAESDREWWVWVGVSGVGLGLIGLWYTRRRRAAIARVRAADVAQRRASGSSDNVS